MTERGPQMFEVPTSVEHVTATPIEGIYIIRRPYYQDSRGGFQETFQTSELQKLDPSIQYLQQGNLSDSKPGVLRGIHAEPWHKLLFVAVGEVQAVWVDMRQDSSTFGQHITMNLEGKPGEARTTVLIPPGIGNGFLVVGSEMATYTYNVAKEYEHRRYPALSPLDPDLGINWQVEEAYMIMSDKDIENPSWRQYSADPSYQ